MTAPECTHGMPSPASCTTCMDEVGLGAPPEELETVVSATLARFNSVCGRCGTEDVIRVGLARVPFDCDRCGNPVEHLKPCAATTKGRSLCAACLNDYTAGKDLNE